jgi:hypothetical protein
VSYELDGKQYIAVQSGWGVDAERGQIALDGIRGVTTHVPAGGSLWVFALPEKQVTAPASAPSLATRPKQTVLPRLAVDQGASLAVELAIPT